MEAIYCEHGVANAVLQRAVIHPHLCESGLATKVVLIILRLHQMAKRTTQPNKQLQNKFRFVVLNDETFEEKFSLTLTRTNVWMFLSVVIVSLIALTSTAIIYTPLKYFIPGFGDYNYKSQIISLQFKTDSLQQAIKSHDVWMLNVMNIASGNIDTSTPQMPKGNFSKDSMQLAEMSEAEETLRRDVDEEQNYALSFGATKDNPVLADVKQLHFFPPAEGYITDDYSAKDEHFGVDIVAPKDAPVKATLDGKIISTSWTLETGYVMVIQHENNLVSFYKHNAQLLKKTGASVQAGEVIGIVGNSGELSTGPHLHFELWHNGTALNPKDYIAFQ